MKIPVSNIPKYSFQDFLKKIYPEDFISNNEIENQPKKTTVSQKLNQILDRKNIEIVSNKNEEAKKNLEKTIKNIIPNITEKTTLDLILWTRLSLSIAIHHDSNVKKIFTEYLKWRNQEGKDFFAVECLEMKNHIHIDKFIFKGVKDVGDFSYQWIAIKPALEKIKNKPNGRSLEEKYGRHNIAKIKEALDKSDENNIVNLEKNNETTSSKKEYIYFGKADDLYKELTKKHRLRVKASIFGPVVSSFVEIRYRGRK